jgi:hypothetical protein
MKKHFVRIATALLGCAILAIAAKAQVTDQLVVRVPYEFVVGGKTLPAGTYRVNRISDSNNQELSLTSLENRAGVLVVSDVVDTARSDKPSLTFQQVGGQRILTRIETAAHVFDIPVSKSAVLVAATKSHGAPAGSAISGTD